MEIKGKKTTKKPLVIFPGLASDLEPNKIPSDVLGSYTGMTEDDEKPVQDADDL